VSDGAIYVSLAALFLGLGYVAANPERDRMMVVFTILWTVAGAIWLITAVKELTG
jgi:hypothetical protein